MRVRARLLPQLMLAALLLPIAHVANAGDSFPGGKPEQRILETQQKVDSLFEKGDYGRAYFIYRNELAPLGDKFAQYMVGYMTLTGKGVEQDIVAASAWYRLAAERGEANFTRVRDELWRHFNDKQRLQSDQEYMNLRIRYSDAMIVAGLIENDLAELERNAAEGVKTQNPGGSTALELAQGDADTVRIRESLATRLDYLDSALDSGQLMTDTEVSRIRDLQKRAEKLLR